MRGVHIRQRTQPKQGIPAGAGAVDQFPQQRSAYAATAPLVLHKHSLYLSRLLVDFAQCHATNAYVARECQPDASARRNVRPRHSVGIGIDVLHARRSRARIAMGSHQAPHFKHVVLARDLANQVRARHGPNFTAAL